jgi:hypothetical protein
MALLPVDFIAWLSVGVQKKGSIHSPENSQLAIIQLQAGKGGEGPVDVDTYHPACTEGERNVDGYANRGEKPVAAVAYWWSVGAETAQAQAQAQLHQDVVKLNGKFHVPGG